MREYGTSLIHSIQGPWKPPKNVGLKEANASTMSRSKYARHPGASPL